MIRQHGWHPWRVSDDQVSRTGRAARPHELQAFMDQVAEVLTGEYERIRSRAKEDPGTAGDEGESNWAALLRDWLPPQFHVVTKGRVLGTNGKLSPQVDVLVLHPAYPAYLRNKKTYLAGGVVAAFECKLTLRREHFTKVGRTAVKLRSLTGTRSGSPHDELHSPLIFGLLAHSHQLGKNAVGTVDQLLRDGLAQLPHPRDGLDAVCVSDLTTWERTTLVMPGPPYVDPNHWPRMRDLYGWPDAGAVDERFRNSEGEPPLLRLLAKLLRRIAWEFPDVRSIADYWRAVPARGAAERDVSPGRWWPLGDVLSDSVVRGIRSGALRPQDFSSKWAMVFE
jgi:hypothetical protein